VVYTTDHGVGDEAVDAKLVELARGADLWILDAQFTPEQRLDFQGWWHTSHLGAIKLALEAEVQTAILFHHDPANDDAILDRMGREAAEVAADSGLQVLMARDGMVVDVGA
jgi:ribonuclease BN (tRNA processing enzyme)